MNLLRTLIVCKCNTRIPLVFFLMAVFLLTVQKYTPQNNLRTSKKVFHLFNILSYTFKIKTIFVLKCALISFQDKMVNKSISTACNKPMTQPRSETGFGEIWEFVKNDLFFTPKFIFFTISHFFFIYWVHQFMGHNLSTTDLILRLTNGKFHKNLGWPFERQV